MLMTLNYMFLFPTRKLEIISYGSFSHKPTSVIEFIDFTCGLQMYPEAVG